MFDISSAMPTKGDKGAFSFAAFPLFLCVGQIVAQMWRLVVGRILPCDGETVDVVVHQRGYSVWRRDVGGEDVQVGGIAAIPKD